MTNYIHRIVKPNPILLAETEKPRASFIKFPKNLADMEVTDKAPLNYAT